MCFYFCFYFEYKIKYLSSKINEATLKSVDIIGHRVLDKVLRKQTSKKEKQT